LEGLSVSRLGKGGGGDWCDGRIPTHRVGPVALSSGMGIVGGGDTPAFFRKSVDPFDSKRVVKHS
jgi:hypothetical protein